jgi:hypothetical protein
VANPEHLAKLEEGPAAWNQRRKDSGVSEPDLSEARPKRKNFEDYKFAKTYFEGAHMIGAKITGCHFTGAFLQKIDLSGAVIEDTDFADANLQEADFDSANIIRSRFEKATLDGAFFFDINLNGVDFGGTSLRGVDLRRTQLEGAFFAGADVEGALLTSATMECADLGDCKGLRFDDTNILHARLTPRPGTFWNRLLNPRFIFLARSPIRGRNCAGRIQGLLFYSPCWLLSVFFSLTFSRSPSGAG